MENLEPANKSDVKRIEDKLDKMIKLLNPIVKIDKELRADIVHVLLGKIDNNYEPRKQPNPDAWIMVDCKTCGKPSSKYKFKIIGKCPNCGAKLKEDGKGSSN